MESFERNFAKYTAPLSLAYQDNLPSNQSLEQVLDATTWFQEMDAQLSEIEPEGLGLEDRLEYHILAFETQLNLESLTLSLAWVKNGSKANNQGIYHQPQGADWYRYMLHAWTGTFLTPDSVQALGHHLAKQFAEARVQNVHLLKNEWFTEEEADIVDRYQKLDVEAQEHLAELFPVIDKLVPLQFAPVASPRMGNVPGYYNANTLYYNTFRTTYDLRQADWLYIHEGIPGHHYQLSFERQVELPAYREGWGYGGYREGWAAYVEEEEIGKALGLYQTPATRSSMYEWNLIRAVRLVLDVGLNYYGWDNTQAMEVWNQYLPDLPEVGQREIARMQCWPGQVLSYLVGAYQIKQLRAQQKERLGPAFSLLEFHQTILSKGSLPVATLPYLFEY